MRTQAGCVERRALRSCRLGTEDEMEITETLYVRDDLLEGDADGSGAADS